MPKDNGGGGGDPPQPLPTATTAATATATTTVTATATPTVIVTAPSSLFAAAAHKFARMAGSSANRSLSPTAAKYRVASSLPNGASALSPSPSSSQSTRKLHDLVRQATTKTYPQGPKLSEAVVGTSITDGSQGPQSDTSLLRGKLPLKIRTSVSRMRSQLALVNNNTTTSESPIKPRQRKSSSGFNATSAAAVASSRRRSSARQPPETHREPIPLSLQTSPSKTVGRCPIGNADPAFVLRFMELVRPLQSSLSSWKGTATSANDEIDDSDDSDDEADAVFRQHERERSRILRICCSLDNLLFAIADDMQDHKHDLLAIARGPAQALVQLILTGIRQIVSTALTTTGSPARPLGRKDEEMPSSLTANEERNLCDFLLEIANRWAELDELVRGVYVANLETAQRELGELQTLYTELKTTVQTLELEVVDLREFNSSHQAATLVVTSNLMRLATRPESPEDSGDIRQEEQRLAGYELLENQEKHHSKHRTGAEEMESLRKQCDEYARLLEMAKQEICLSHQERQAQHAQLVELSQSLLKDQEVAQLRTELQAEKKRVKRLEMESLSLRETQLDLNMKIQSLMRNQHPPTSIHPKMNGNAAATTAVTATTSSQPRSRPGSIVVWPDNGLSSLLEAETPLVQDAIETTDTLASSVEASTLDDSLLSACAALPTNVDGKTLWLCRLLVPSDTSVTHREDDGLVRRFLAELLMTENEFVAAAAQSKLRKQANVPTTGSPPLPLGSSMPPAKKKSKSAVSDPDAVVVPIEDWVQDTIVVTSVRQLIWVFYELYLMADEAQRIDPEMCGRKQWYQTTTPSLASIVVHYFLARHVNEHDAIANLKRFVVVLSNLRLAYGDMQLFCEFLDGTRSREELHFYLWVLQAIDAVQLGVNYDLESSVVNAQPTRVGRYVCTLKALYVSRMVYQYLHLKSLKKPSPVVPTGGKKAKPVVAPVEVPPPTTSAPSKKLRKNRPHSASRITLPVHPPVIESPIAMDPPVHKVVSIIEQATQHYARAIAANSGCPLTLESFNSVVLSFAEAVSHEELQNRLGAFYQPTGDERKLALDLLLVLLMELFATQLQWRKTQLHALFVRLAKEEEVAALLAAKVRQNEADTAAPAAQGSNGRGSQVGKTKEKKETKKVKLSPSKKRQRRAGLDSSNDKYLCGLTRERLRAFLIQGGLIKRETVDHVDVDAIYVALLDATNRTPSEIHFEELYAALQAMELLGNDSEAVDFSAWEFKDREEPIENQKEIVLDQWKQMSSRAMVLVENDPNMFTRQAARHLLRRVHTTIASSRTDTCEEEMGALHAMRGFLIFAWRVACRRLNARTDRKTQLQCCLTECFHLNQAITTITSSADHYASTVDLAGVANVVVTHQQHYDPLAIFYEVHASSPLGDTMDSDMRDVQHVLQRYSLYVAHLFDTHSSARYMSRGLGLTKDQWVAMVKKLGLVHEHGLSFATCEALFIAVGSAREGGSGEVSHEENPQGINFQAMQIGHEMVVKKASFASLLVQVAVKRYEVIKSKHKNRRRETSGARNLDALLTVAQIVEQFCRDVIAPNAFRQCGRGFEDTFHQKLASLQVAQVLLEHRAFLRQLFFHYATTHHYNVECSTDESFATGENRLHTRHNSMVLTQFIGFLDAFDLLESRSSAVTTTSGSYSSPDACGLLRLDAIGVAYLFRAVMAIESSDETPMEFDDFAAAIVAIACNRNPHPFCLLHVKIDAFVAELRLRARHVLGVDEDTTAHRVMNHTYT